MSVITVLGEMKYICVIIYVVHSFQDTSYSPSKMEKRGDKTKYVLRVICPGVLVLCVIFITCGIEKNVVSLAITAIASHLCHHAIRVFWVAHILPTFFDPISHRKAVT